MFCLTTPEPITGLSTKVLQLLRPTKWLPEIGQVPRPWLPVTLVVREAGEPFLALANCLSRNGRNCCAG